MTNTVANAPRYARTLSGNESARDDSCGHGRFEAKLHKFFFFLVGPIQRRRLQSEEERNAGVGDNMRKSTLRLGSLVYSGGSVIGGGGRRERTKLREALSASLP